MDLSKKDQPMSGNLLRRLRVDVSEIPLRIGGRSPGYLIRIEIGGATTDAHQTMPDLLHYIPTACHDFKIRITKTMVWKSNPWWRCNGKIMVKQKFDQVD